MFVLLITVQGIEPRALCMLGKCPTTELHTHPPIRELLAALAFLRTCAAVWSGHLVENGYREGNWHGGGAYGKGGSGDKEK